MTIAISTDTGGASFGSDALPLCDLSASAVPQFERRGNDVLLRGCVSASSGTVYFPFREISQEGGSRDLSPISFGPRGTLYSFSTVHVSSTREVPYTIGYVDFDNGARVLAQVEWGDDQSLHCDAPVELRAEGDRWFVSPVAAAATIQVERSQA